MVGHLPLEEVILVRVQVWQPTRAPEFVKGLERSGRVRVPGKATKSCIARDTSKLLIFPYQRYNVNIMKNSKYIYAIIVLVIILITGYFLFNNRKPTAEINSSITTNPTITSIKSDQDLKNPTDKTSYPVGSYNVFITQTGGIGSTIQPKIKVYNANTGSELKPVENYVYYMFFAQKTSGDTLSSYCALNSLSSFHPINVKSTSGNNISQVPNIGKDPKSDNSINMLLNKDENNLSFVCIPW